MKKIRIKIEKNKYQNRNGKNIVILLSNNGYYWNGTPLMNIEDLKELRKFIRKYIKQNSEK